MTVRRLGAVLAGGRSSRFGSDKASALWQGRPLIDHAIDALQTICVEVVACGRQREGGRWLADRPAGDLGPLGGLNAALHFARANGYATVISIGCDTPWLPPDLLGRLASHAGAAFVETLPVIGCWPVALADELDLFLHEDSRRSMRGWARRAAAESWAGYDVPNINFRADLDTLVPGPVR